MRLFAATLLAAFAALLAADAHAIGVKTVFLEADVAGGINSPSLNTVASDGGTAYAFTNGDGSNDVGAVVEFDGTNFTTVSSNPQWQATGSTNDIFASEGAGIVGSALRFTHTLDNAVYEVVIATGVVTEVVATSDFAAALPGTVNLTSQFEVAADGTIYGVNSPTDSLYVVSPTNGVSVELADFNATLGGDSIRGIGISGDLVYITDNDTDTLWAWDTVLDTATAVLTASDIDPLTSDVDGVAAFGDVLAGPDGLVYFYEADGDDLMVFDPADPVNTLSVLVSTAEFAAGPSSDTINQLAWWDGRIAFTDGSIGFFTIVPEPTSALLGLIALAGFAARRR